MYIDEARTYYAGSEQRAMRSRFLLLLQRTGGPYDAASTFAVVRKVALRQFGHYMMGRANLNGKWYTVSGPYGNDGLPMDVERLPADAKPLPPALFEAWNKGGGWNSAGSEAPAMREWALREWAVPAAS